MPDFLDGGMEGIGGSGLSGPAVLLAALLLLIVMAIITAIFVLYSRTSQGRLEGLVDKQRVGVQAGSWFFRVTMLLIIGGVVVAGDWYLDRSTSCLTCHGDDGYAETLAETVHAGQKCSDCHDRTGLTGVARQTVDYGRWIYVYSTEGEVPDMRPGSVESEACLKCHGEVREDVTETRGIRVRHSDFLDAGFSCRECHNSIGHGDLAIEPSEPSMSRCLGCHNGRTASTECRVCHSQDVSEDAVALADDMVDVELTRNSGDCYACHEQARCTSCHGVTMPHPPEWYPADNRPGEHVRLGFSQRDLCYRCHNDGQPFQVSAKGCGGDCHAGHEVHGGRGWVQEHGLQATGVKQGVFADCFTCHRTTLCDDCHDSSYAERYNPRQGGLEDDYPREVPLDPDLANF